MTLAELAFSCACYGRSTDYDKPYLDFLQSTNGELDLSNPQHRKLLLVWLNQWGCRQFAVEYHKQASTVLRRAASPAIEPLLWTQFLSFSCRAHSNDPLVCLSLK